MESVPKRVGLLYEHPIWSADLIDRLERRGVDVVALDVGDRGAADALAGLAPSLDRLINRVNAMPSAGRPPSVVAATGHLLLDLELQGVPVVNGHRTWALGASKAAQAGLFNCLGLGTPPSIAVHDPSHVATAAQELGFPVLVKPNVGGSGSGIERYDRPDVIEEAVSAGVLSLGIDGTGVVQRVIESADGLVHRVEMLGTELFYATDQVVDTTVFNYCAADGCAVDGGIELVTPDPEVVAAAASVMAAAGADAGGVEYLIDRASGQPSFFDFNPYSNFVAGRNGELGFDPIDRYLDHVLDPAWRPAADRRR